MDCDGDGRLDLITGSYTGQMYLFRRQPDGSFGKREELVDETGHTILRKDYSIVPELVDMDGDGDLDLVVGARTDPVQVIDNVGTRQVPRWSKESRKLRTTAGAEIVGSNAHHADWDGDGVRDLIVGSEWGEVRWYRNTGADDRPAYEDRGVLVARGDYERGAEGSAPKHPGMRVKVHVTDWNGDGRADLLLGDVVWQEETLPPLSPEKETERKRLTDLENDLEKRQQKLPKGTERDEIEKQLEELRPKLYALATTRTHSHGFVWLFLRKDGAAKPEK